MVNENQMGDSTLGLIFQIYFTFLFMSRIILGWIHLVSTSEKKIYFAMTTRFFHK